MSFFIRFVFIPFFFILVKKEDNLLDDDALLLFIFFVFFFVFFFVICYQKQRIREIRVNLKCGVCLCFFEFSILIPLFFGWLLEVSKNKPKNSFKKLHFLAQKTTVVSRKEKTTTQQQNKDGERRTTNRRELNGSLLRLSRGTSLEISVQNARVLRENLPGSAHRSAPFERVTHQSGESKSLGVFELHFKDERV